MPGVCRRFFRLFITFLHGATIGRVCRRVFLLFITFLLAKFLVLLLSTSIIEVEAARDGSNLPKFDDKIYNESEYWQRYKGGGKNYLAGDSKLEKVKNVTKQKVKSENKFESWWRERPAKEDLGFILERKDESKRRAKRKKKRIVKTHDHKFAISHNDL